MTNKAVDARIKRLAAEGVIDEDYIDHLARRFEEILNQHTEAAELPARYEFRKVERDES